MSFKDPKKLWKAVENLVQSDKPRAENRARINSLCNGDPPWSQEEAAEDRVETNVNFLDATQLIHRARSQYSNAFLKPENFFQVTLEVGPSDLRGSWGKIITRLMNRTMKRSSKYFTQLENKFSSVTLHGIGPALWYRDKDWCPKTFGVEDVLVPSKTTTDLDNLEYFAVYQTYTPSQLVRMTMGKSTDKGWNIAVVKKALKKMTEEIAEGNQNSDADNYDFPEKFEEDLKGNSAYWSSDAVPVLRCYDVYFLDTETKEKDPVWRRKTIIDQTTDQFGLTRDNTVLYDGKEKDYGTEINRIMHVQFADGAVVPPSRWHSVRSLGYQIYAVCHLQNRMNCKFSDAVFEHMLWYFRNVTSGDQEKLDKIDFHHLGVIPEGLSWVPPNERHTIDFNLVSGYMNMNRTRMQEHAATYVRDTDQAQQREPETATAIMARVNTSNALIGSMLQRSYTYQTYEYREIARRFCTLDHKDCKEFRDRCMQEGVPKEVFGLFEEWNIIPERVLGAGNKMLGIAQAERLMAVRPLLDPDAQRRVTHMYVEENTDDPLLANELVPLEGPMPSEGETMATLAWGTLIDGKPVIVPNGIDRIGYVETLLKFLASDIQRINQEGGTPDLRRIQGLANVVQHVGELVEQLAQDEGIDERTKMYKDVLGKAANEIKGYMQRLQEAMEAAAEQQIDPETQAKIQGQIALDETKREAMAASADLKMQIAEAKFQADQQRKNMQTMGNEERKNVQLQGDQGRQGAKVQADLTEQAVRLTADVEAQDIKTAAEIEAQKAKTEADVQATKTKAKAKPKASGKKQ